MLIETVIEIEKVVLKENECFYQNVSYASALRDTFHISGFPADELNTILNSRDAFYEFEYVDCDIEET